MTDRAVIYGRQAIYLWVALIFTAYGIESWVSDGVPERIARDGLVYPIWWWRIMFPLAAAFSYAQLGRFGRPRRWIEGGWVLFGITCAGSRAAQVLEVSANNDWATGPLLGWMTWGLVCLVIIVGMDHRIRYRNRQ